MIIIFLIRNGNYKWILILQKKFLYFLKKITERIKIISDLETLKQFF
jgi:hypothetical protein